MTFIDTTRAWARRMKRDAMTLWFARSHPATPWYAKALGVFVVAYALSPIDLIPDFVPVLGYLDDVILLPMLIWLALRLLPAAVLEESRQKAERWMAESREKPRSLVGGVAIVLIWIVVAAVLALWLASALRR
ncbi:MAG: YkvA family protein [Burkholderiales bacterium]